MLGKTVKSSTLRSESKMSQSGKLHCDYMYKFILFHQSLCQTRTTKTFRPGQRRSRQPTRLFPLLKTLTPGSWWGKASASRIFKSLVSDPMYFRFLLGGLHQNPYLLQVMPSKCYTLKAWTSLLAVQYGPCLKQTCAPCKPLVSPPPTEIDQWRLIIQVHRFFFWMGSAAQTGRAFPPSFAFYLGLSSKWQSVARCFYCVPFWVWRWSKYPILVAPSIQAFLPFSGIFSSYDLQVSKTSQRHGLGRALMNHLAKIGADFGMDKIMLTVFKGSSFFRYSPP